ncbi:DUF1958 domain-containing protein [Enterococcus sp. LJL51]|uniref:DUF1958 domain-containing protein n=1 Tax=Enterococcus sp. LJL51 TaxID=3416656 RepID=UPI003CFB744F
MYKNKKIHLALLLSLLFSFASILPGLTGYAEEGTGQSEITNSETMTSSEEAPAPEDIMTITRNAGYTVDDFYRPAASIVIDASSGQVIWEDQADQTWYPASIAKMMTVYLLFDAIKQGTITLDTTVTATESDQAISEIYELSNSPIVSGVAYPVTDLLYMTTMASSNAATVMLANLVTNNDAAAFITMMNTKAQELGMTNTTFYNPSGAAASAFNGYYSPAGIDPEADNVSTARDLALMFYHLLKNHPEVLEYTNKQQITVMENTEYAELLENSNKSIPGGLYGYEGEDGLKTGASPEAAYNYAATATRDGMRLIEVVLGVGDWTDAESENQRHAFGNALFDYGFNTFEYRKLLDAGTQTINNKEIILDQEFFGLLRKGTQPEYILSDNQQLLLSNQLNQVSSSIPAPSIPYQLKEDKKAKEEAETKSSTADSSLLGKIKQAWKEYALVAALLVIAVLLLMYAGTTGSKTKRSRRRATSHRQTAFILGITLILAAILLGGGTFILGPWLPF